VADTEKTVSIILGGAETTEALVRSFRESEVLAQTREINQKFAEILKPLPAIVREEYPEILKPLSAFVGKYNEEIPERQVSPPQIIVPPFNAIRAEAERRRQFEDAMIKLAERQESQAEAGISQSKPTHTSQNPIIDRNRLGYSGLLKVPDNADDWFQVIDDMARDFFADFGRIPNKVQAWVRLCDTPPMGYSITVTKDRGENSLKMSGVKPLGRRGFNDRWERYTAP